MTNSSTSPKVASAYGFLATNLLVLPGLGTFLAEEKPLGVIQMIISVIGVTASLYGLYALMMDIYQHYTNISMILHGAGLWTLIIGIIIFLVSWIWSLASSCRLIKQAQREA